MGAGGLLIIEGGRKASGKGAGGRRRSRLLGFGGRCLSAAPVNAFGIRREVLERGAGQGFWDSAGALLAGLAGSPQGTLLVWVE